MARPAAATMSCTNAFSNMQFGSIDVLAGTAIYHIGRRHHQLHGGDAERHLPILRQRARRSGRGGQSTVHDIRLEPAAIQSILEFRRHVSLWQLRLNYLGGGEPVTVQANGSGGVYVSGTAYYGVIPGGQQSVVPGSYTEYMAQVSSQNIQYGSLYSAGSCPIGAYNCEFSFYVYATVITNCNISTISGLTFATSSALTSNVDTTGSISVQCTNTTPYSISLDNGTHASGSQRRMYSAATGAYISYNLYTDAAHTDAWTATTSDDELHERRRYLRSLAPAPERPSPP